MREHDAYKGKNVDWVEPRGLTGERENKRMQYVGVRGAAETRAESMEQQKGWWI